MNKDTIITSMLFVIVGGASYKIAKEIRKRKLQKEFYGVVEDGHQNEE